MQDLNVSVVEKLEEARKYLRPFHLKSHQLKIVFGDQFSKNSCAFCQKDLASGVKFLRCVCMISEQGGQAVADFCNQACHDNWVAAPDFGDPHVYHDEIIPWAARLEAVGHCLRDINYNVGLASDCLSRSLLEQVFAQIQVPRVDWGGVNERPELIATIEEQRRFAREEVFAILTFRADR